MNIDIRFADLEYEIWALKEFQRAMADAIEHLAAQRAIRTRSRSSADGVTPDDPEFNWAMDELTAFKEEVVPRLHRGPMLISLWAYVETSLDQVAMFVSAAKGQRLQFRDVTGRTLKQRCERYFDYVLNYPLGIDENAWARLDEIRKLRNVAAHSNGRFDLVNETDQKFVRRLIADRKGVNEQRGFVVIDERYLSDAIGFVCSILGHVIKCIKRDFDTAR